MTDRVEVDALGQASAPALEGRTLEAPNPLLLRWSDEFAPTADGFPDPLKWDYDLGDWGWGNHEEQNYVEHAAFIARDPTTGTSRLVIPINWDTSGPVAQYTSARLVTRGKFGFTYGRVEVRAKVALTRGSWSAIWTLPDEWTKGSRQWPDVGEMDIMEHVGMDPGNVHGTVHTKAYNHMINTQQGKVVSIGGPTEREWHTYSLVWTPESITWAVDGRVYNEFLNDGGDYATWPFDQPHHLIMNVAVGGDWGGQLRLDDNTLKRGELDPRNTMEVDWVRVYHG